MVQSTIDIQIEILHFLNDGEYHSLTATVLGVGKGLHLTKKEMNEYYDSDKNSSKNYIFSLTKIHKKVRTEVSHLRKARFLKDFPKTQKLGFFAITEKGLELSQKNKLEIKKILNSELKKTRK